MTTHRDRVLAALSRQPLDQVPFGDSLWPETYRRYVSESCFPDKTDVVSHFDMSWRSGGWLNSTADLEFKDQVLEETPETVLKLTGNGARLRYWKNRSGTPEHVGFTVTDREGWERLIKPHLLKTDRRRIPFEGYRRSRAAAAAEGRAFCWSGIAPFEQIHPMCGHENMLIGMALDPDWVRDMVMTYAEFTLRHQAILFSEEGLPDFMWYYEDMGFKEKPFMSPAMYADIVQPGHRLLFGSAREQGLKVLVHSCGFVAPLVPGLIEAGMDALQAMEVKAGMDLPALAREFGDRIAFCGGLDIREVATNDRTRIEAEFERRMRPVLEAGCGYILHSDHSIPPEVNHDTLRFFFERGVELSARWCRRP